MAVLADDCATTLVMLVRFVPASRTPVYVTTGAPPVVAMDIVGAKGTVPAMLEPVSALADGESGSGAPAYL
jgi:hypothetical protein